MALPLGHDHGSTTGLHSYRGLWGRGGVTLPLSWPSGRAVVMVVKVPFTTALASFPGPARLSFAVRNPHRVLYFRVT